MACTEECRELREQLEQLKESVKCGLELAELGDRYNKLLDEVRDAMEQSWTLWMHLKHQKLDQAADVVQHGVIAESIRLRDEIYAHWHADVQAVKEKYKK